jgi:8-oxo-dGTP pyrophosphatase MutT (NUDIX family)
MRVFDVENRTAWKNRATPQQTVKFFRLSQVRRLRQCQQVAAVCYRMRKGEIEFLLVQTRGGRWTFPKGSVEPGLTHAQAAALEAFEEAGVHGRMEEISFARYVRRRGPESSSGGKQIETDAHLCEVSRLVPPQEFNRNRTWFSPQKAKRRLREGRTADYAAELARVVDRAITRIQRLRLAVATPALPLQERDQRKIQFIDGFRSSPVINARSTSAGRGR